MRFLHSAQKNEDFPGFTVISCVVHQNVLCAKVLNMGHVMEMATEMVNSVRARTFGRRVSRTQLEQNETC